MNPLDRPTEQAVADAIADELTSGSVYVLDRRPLQASGLGGPDGVLSMYLDKRLLTGGVVLVVLLGAWAIGEKGFPLAKLVQFGMHSILR